MNYPSEDRRRRTEDREQRIDIRHPPAPRSSFSEAGASVFRLRAFTLVESMAATALLAFIGASIWVVMERCMTSAVDTTQRMRAFEVARENMEKLIGSDSVQEMTEYGASEQYPDIRWQNTVESFYEPLASRMWVRAVCVAEYTDSTGETKTVELTHWLTDLTNDQLQQMMKRNELLKQMLAKYIIETDELAAQYAGVNVETIQEWVKNGMPTAGDGTYLKPWLDTYLRTDGRPTAQDKQDTITEFPEMAAAQNAGAAGQQTTPGPGTAIPGDLDPVLRDQLQKLGL